VAGGVVLRIGRGIDAEEGLALVHVLSFAFYPLTYAGLVVLMRRALGGFTAHLLLDGAIAMFAALALDDFGKGVRVAGLPAERAVDVVKLDRAFVAGSHHPVEAALLRAAVELGRALGVDAVAEDVETTEQLERLQALHCPLGQGWLFAKPLPAADITDLLLTELAPH
jgi:EAL domain-containing protein (putative c-di-GMP-specific phosphodiesterase class I)